VFVAVDYGTTERQETRGAASVHVDSKYSERLADSTHNAGGGYVGLEVIREKMIRVPVSKGMFPELHL
jgi:hypothetical protein